jgi:hypothetical protein
MRRRFRAMRAKCPNCKLVVDVKRTPQGQGTLVDLESPLSRNEFEMLGILSAMQKEVIAREGVCRGFTVRSIQKWIAEKRITHKPRGKVKRTPIPWTDHYIQSSLSLLVGRGLVKANHLGATYAYFLPSKEIKSDNLDSFLAS